MEVSQYPNKKHRIHIESSGRKSEQVNNAEDKLADIEQRIEEIYD